MSVNRRIGLGFVLSVDPAGGTSFVALGSIVDGFDEGEAKADVADVSILIDFYKQKAKGQVDPGTVNFDIAYDPDDIGTSTLILALKEALPNPNWKISYPSGSTGAGTIVSETFLGFLSGIGRTVKKDKLVIAKIEITKTGQPGFAGN